MATGNRRLLKLADELERVPKARFVARSKGFRGYSQLTVVHPCGSPACAWGHYVVNNKTRRKRILKSAGENTYYEKVIGEGTVRLPNIWTAVEEFALETGECDLLFERHGCNHAKTGKEAATFIRKFVDYRVRERSHDSK